MATNGVGDASRPRIVFEPGLEGLRGFALLGMLCFHSEFSWAVGGFLPIATFFTLSGYLITALFLAEWQRSGRIRLVAFWARRFRRLMPAALLTLGTMSLFAVFVATPDQVERLRAEVLWALAYVVNWHFILADVAYRNLLWRLRRSSTSGRWRSRNSSTFSFR
jgi:peptidoglycan/LPS O-acetylase OafA/YrhL